MDSKSPSRRRKYTNVNRKNVVIEKKFESEIRQYDREAAGMLCNHLHNTIQLMETMKQVKRSSGQIDSDMKGTRTPSDSGNIQDLARNATKWCYCKSYSYNDWDELHRSDFWRRTKRPCTVGPDDNIARNLKMKNKRDIQRKLLTDRPKTVGSRLYLRGLEENYKNHKTTSEQLIPIQQKQAGRNNGKEKISIDINSKVFKLAHGLVKTPNIRRFHGNDDSNTSEESATEDNDDNSTNTDEELSNSQRYKPNVQNSGGFLAPEGMNLEARRASRGNEDMAGIFRLAIERQRRLSVVTGDEYAEWALQMGITNYNGEYSDGEADENEITEDKGYETTSDLINDGKIPERSTSDTNWNYDGGKQDSKLKVQNLPTSGIHSKLNEKKRLSNETTEKISLTERTTRIREPKKGRELKKSPRNALNTKVKDELNKKKEREKVRENKSVISDTKHESGESQSQESANIHEQSDQTNDEIPTETNQRKIGTGLTTGLSEKQLSTQDICQNVTDSNLKELRKINEEPNLFSSDDDDDTDESEEKETDDKDNVKEAAEKEMKMKKELELVQRRLQVSSFESKKFKLKIYVKPQLRYKTERMYLLRRKNLLHRQIALASQDMAGADAILPGSEGRFTLQHQVVSTNKNWRQRQLNNLINNNTSQQHVSKNNTSGSIPRERIDQFLQKVSQFIEGEKRPGIFV